MSEDPTQDIGPKYDTKPTIETVLQRLSEIEERLTARMDARFDALENRIDRVESIALTTRGELLELRADFPEFRTEARERLKEPA